MPYKPAPAPVDPSPDTDRLPQETQHTREAQEGREGREAREGRGTAPAPAADAPAPPPVVRAEVPVHAAAPYQQPAAPTRILPPDRPGTDPPRETPSDDRAGAHPVAPPNDSRLQRASQLLGLGALTSAVVAYAPYAGTGLIATLVLLLRTASVTRERHGRRLLVRGRPRWYDVPKTTLSLPAYALIACLGAVGAVAVAGLSGAAMFSLAFLFGQPVTVGLVAAGLGFTPALWWGPGSGRLRETTRELVARTARSEFGGWFVIVMSLLGAAVFFGLLLSAGPNWAPALSAPWK